MALLMEQDFAQLAQAWKSWSNARRSRLLQRLTSKEKLILKQVIRDANRHQGKNLDPSGRSSNAA